MPAKRTPANLDDLIERYLSGVSMKQLADEIEISRKALTSRFLECGVPLRGRSDAELLKWSKIPESERKQRMVAAHNGRRGMKESLETLCRRAQGRYQTCSHTSDTEHELSDYLRSHGVHVDQQYPLGPYNIDLVLRELSVAVEVSAINPQRTHRALRPDRIEYIFDEGLGLILVFSSHWGAADVGDKILTLKNTLGRNKTSVSGKYGVIRGDGQPIASRGRYLKNRTRIPGF